MFDAVFVCSFSAKNEVSADTTVFQSGALGKAPDG